MCIVVGAVIAGIFLTRPRFFLRNYPEAVREVVPPLSDREKRFGMLAGLPLFAALLGFPTWSAWSLNLRHGGDAMVLQLFLAAGSSSTCCGWATFHPARRCSLAPSTFRSCSRGAGTL
jgi:hypothetical protein